MSSRSQAVRSASSLMVLTLGSRLLGFVRIGVIAAVFGASGRADVLNLVFNIPNNLRKLLAEGALSAAFVPSLVRVRETSADAAKHLVREIIGFQIVALMPLLLIALVAPHWITNLILDFPEVERRLLSAELFRYLAHYVLLISIAAVAMATLNAEGRFAIPGSAPLLFSVSVISSIVIFADRLGIFSVAIGVLLGGVLQIVVQLPSLRRLDYRLVPSFRFRDPTFRAVIRTWLPIVATSSAFAINQQVALYFASGLADGSGSALTNAIVFWQLPLGVISASVTTVVFPALSRAAARSDAAETSRLLQGSAYALVLLLVPAGVGLAVLSREIIAVGLQRGAFGLSDTLLAARVLRFYGPGLAFVGLFTLAQRARFAAGDTRGPFCVASVTVAVDIALSLWLKDTELGVAGLALASSCSYGLGSLALLRLSRVKALWRRIALGFVQAGVATGAAAGAVVAVRALYTQIGVAPDWWTNGSTVASFGLLLGPALAALLTIAAVYRVLGIRLRGISSREVMR